MYKLKTAYQFKSFTLNLKETKGYKAIKSVTMYVNNVQDMDIAEMKGNWAIWQKVIELQIESETKSSFTANLPIPVTATNVLFEYNIVNLTKPIEPISKRGYGYSMQQK